MSRALVTADLIRTRARALRMPGLARGFEALCRQAEKERWTFEEFLAECLAVEVTSRSDSAVRQRLRDARFPDIKTLDQFDFTAAGGIDAAVVAKLARVDWLDRKENIVFAGPVGTGKTHLAIALGVEAAKQRRRVAFVRAADLVRLLLEARDSRELGRVQRRFDRVDLLILDEVGFVPFGRDGGELLFNLIAHRYERRSLIVTTNLPFAEWPKVFGDDEKLTTALLDRLADRAMVIVTKGKSYRMLRRQAQPTAPEPEEPETTKTKKR